MREQLLNLADAVLGAMATGLVQGLLLAVGVAIVLRLLRRANAATRYAVSFVALLVVVALPGAHGLSVDGWVRDGLTWARGMSARLDLSRPTPVNPDENVLGAAPQTGAWAPGESGVPDLTESTPESLESLEQPGSHADANAGAGLDVAALASGEVDAAEPVTVEGLDGSVDASGPVVADAGVARPTWRFSTPRWLGIAVILTWLCVAGVRLVRLGIQCVALRRMRDLGVPAAEPMQDVFDRLRDGMEVARTVDLKVVPHLASPILVGWFRPTVLMPEALTRGSVADWEPMLIHELAHVRRWDDWTNLIQQGLAAVFFYHPAVLWLSRRLAVDREIACDDHVLSAKGSPRKYALFLTEHARRMQGPDWAAAPAAWSNPSQLKERIHMLLDTQRNASPRLARMRAGAWTTTVLLLAAIGFYAVPRLSVAGSADASAGTDAVETVVSAVTDDTSVTTQSVDANDVSVDLNGVVADVLASVDVRVEDTGPVKIKTPRHATVVQDADATRPLTPPLPPVPAEVPQTAVVVSGPDILIAPTPPMPALAVTVAPADVLAEAPLALPAPEPHPLPAPHPTIHLTPKPPKPPKVKEGRMASSGDRDELERRLDRLEKMVQELAEKRGAGWDANVLKGEWAPKVRVELERELAPLREKLRNENRNIEVLIEKSREQAKKQADEAVRQVERMKRDAEVRVRAETFKADAAASAGSAREAQRKPLEAQRRMLERQMAQLEAQMGKLEAELDRLDDESERIAEEMEEKGERARREPFERHEDPAVKRKEPKADSKPGSPEAPRPEAGASSLASPPTAERF